MAKRNHVPENYSKYIEPHRGMILVAAGLAWLFFTLLSWATIFGCGLIFSGIFLNIYLRIVELKRNGFIDWLPIGLQKILLERSILDILCDIWYIPRLKLLLRTFLTPFFMKIHPEKAVQA